VLQDPPQIQEKEFSSRKLSMAETEAELGSFHLWTHDLLNARPLVEQALKDDPNLGIAHENMGFLNFADGKDTDAANEFTQAYALDRSLYLSLFAKTMLSSLAVSKSAADRAALHEVLIKVTELNPNFAPAYIERGRPWLRQNDPKLAYSDSRKAEELEPSRAGYHILTGYILLRMGKGAEAAAFAKPSQGALTPPAPSKASPEMGKTGLPPPADAFFSRTKECSATVCPSSWLSRRKNTSLARPPSTYGCSNNPAQTSPQYSPHLA
jgi:hypothetical protein